MDAAYNAQNTRTRERLQKITARLTDADLKHILPNGWSVATTLVHLSFWDRYYLAILDEWQRSGYIPAKLNVEAINETIEFISGVITPQNSVQLANSAAELIDQRLIGISSDLANAIEESGYERMLQRYVHRAEHLDQIELFLNSHNK